MAHPNEQPDSITRNVVVQQTVETPVTFAAVPNAYVRFAYARSSDSMANQIEGQDYLCFRHNERRLAFVVADGVGSSFCGNLAARFLGDHLLDWLWTQETAFMTTPAALTEAASSFLNRLQKQAQMEVEEYEIAGEMSPLIRQALEAQRSYGSEAIFAACRIDHPGPTAPDGAVAVIWMGDTVVRLLNQEGAKIELGGSWENANRWSTAKGVRGSMSGWLQRSLKNISRAAAFTDGLSAHSDRVLDYPDAHLDREIHLGSRLPTSDDVAIIDVVLRSPLYEGYPDTDAPDLSLERPHLEPIWNPTGEPTYELRWTWSDTGNRSSTIIQEATNPALNDSRTINVPEGITTWQPEEPQQPGHYYYRVRAMRRYGPMTPWSDLRHVKVASPPPPAPTVYPVEPEKAAVLHWEADGELLEYIVQQADMAEFEEPVVVYEGRGTAWSIPTSTPGTTYFRVQAISTGGPGPWSEPRAVEITLPPPPMPHLATISYGYVHGEYTLRWQPVPGATHYELEKTSHGGVSTAEIEDSILHIDNERVGEFTYRVRACHAYGCSAWSNPQTVIISPRPPAGAPELTITGPDENGLVVLSWDELPRADDYIIEVADGEFFNNARMYTQAHRTLELTRREPGGHYFRVCGANSGGESAWSNIESFVILPDAPEWIEARPSEDKSEIVVTWGNVGGRVSYHLQVATDTELVAFETTLYEGEETRFTVPAKEPYRRARFRVRSEMPELAGGWVTSRAVLLDTDPPPPSPAAELHPLVVGPGGELQARWDVVSGAAGYQLQVANNADFNGCREIDAGKTGMDYRPPAAGQYWFRVRARYNKPGGDQFGAWSQVLTITVDRPGSPRLLPAGPYAAGTIVEIGWEGIPECRQYTLEESPDADFATITKTVPVSHPTVKAAVGPNPAGTYYYRVRATDYGDHDSLWSNTVQVVLTDTHS